MIFTGRRADGGRRLYLGKYPDGGNRRQRKMLSRRIGIIEMFSRAGGSWNVPDDVRFHSNRSSFVAPEALRSNGNWIRCLRRMAPFLANSSKNPPLPVRLTLVSKNGHPAHTPTCSVSRGRLRRRNRTKGDLPLALQFVRGPGGGSPAVGGRGIQYKWKFLLESHF